MFKAREIRRLCPLLIFVVVYTAVFFVWVKTFYYTLPFLLGLIVAIAIQPIISLLDKKLHLNHTVSSAITTFTVIALLLSIISFLGIFAVREIAEFIVHAGSSGFKDFSTPVANFLNKLGEYFQNLDMNFFERNKEEIMNILQSSADVLVKFFGTVLSVVTSLPTLIVMVIVIGFSAFFISRDMEKLRAWVKNFLTSGAIFHMKSVAENSEDMGRKYLISYLFLYFLTFCESTIVLTVLELSYPLTTALITALADILPVLGPGLIFVSIAIYQLLIGEYTKAIGIAIGWGIISLIRQVIEPQLVSSTVKIHPLVMLAAIYFSLVGKSIWLLIYTVGFFTLYSSFRKTGALPSLTNEKNTETQKSSV